MEQPPLIDVEPEDGGKSRLMGCAGCLGKIVPLAAGVLLLSIVLMAGALFIWGGDLERKSKDGAEGTESVEGKKKGFAGVMDKVKRAVKGEKAVPEETSEEGQKAVVSGEEGGERGQGGASGGQGAAGGDSFAGAAKKSAELAQSLGAEEKSPEERNRLLREKFGHLEENRPQGGDGEAVNLGEIAGGGAGQGGGSGANPGGDGMAAARDALGGGAGGLGGELPPFGEEGGLSAEQAAAAKGLGQKASGAGSGLAAGAGGEAGGGGSANGGPVARKRRGGSFGSSTGTATVTGTKSQYQRWRGDFSTSGSDLEFEVIYQEAGGQLQFRCFVMPYDAQTAKFFRADKGDFLLSFRDKDGQRLVPAGGDLPIALTKLTAFEAQGKVMGWVARGMIPLNGEELSDLKSVRLGWDFDKDLGDWLKNLKKSRSK